MITTVVWLIAGLLMTQLLLLIWMMIRKKRELVLQERVKNLDEKLTKEFRAFIDGEVIHHPRFPDEQKLKIELMESILERSLEGADTLEKKDRIRQLAEASLGDIYRNRLHYAGWSNRINALYFIEDFRMYSLDDEVYTNTDRRKQKKDEEFRQGLRTMAALQDRRVFLLLEEDLDLPFPLLKEVFQRLDQASIAYWFSRYETTADIPEPLLCAFISHCGDVKSEDDQEIVELALNDSRAEVRIKALKALSSYQAVREPARLLLFFQSEQWEERLMVAKLAGHAGLKQYRTQLMKLMEDREWWVRFAAANAIRMLPDGEAHLREIASTHKDPYARDMADRTLTTKWGMTS
ncbi:HEAT repeat domain-containing protein [Salisediminibacterium selenitireducens]|uniref:HEAT repeat domain-containing protein n=1 Tax=Bacillus selenitireducens (strain ATCC 700615 / DSM 15326 / MLS10) TaxID=439292 RepID=D6Y1F5_BACIE|nr:HEAT repeat domain-containing protein [Salisediminibacterium selenitireducens]ADI00742.1 hypothetical protein Bsel_3260 [[Bacillus] selenitireducens MLS10]